MSPTPKKKAGPDTVFRAAYYNGYTTVRWTPTEGLRASSRGGDMDTITYEEFCVTYDNVEVFLRCLRDIKIKVENAAR